MTRPPALEEAADWYMRRIDEADPTATDAAFALWHEAKEENRQAWARITATMDQVAQAGRPKIRPSRMAVVTAAALSTALAFAGHHLYLRDLPDYTSAHATMTTIALDDGTAITLAVGAAINVDLSQTTRAVTLLTGEAFFDVTPDSARPFVVTAQDHRFIVYGTAFDVALQDESVTVDLLKGSLGLEGDAAGPLAPGERLVVTEAGPARAAIAPDTIGLWREGALDVSAEPLRQVLARMQPWNPSWVTLLNPDIGAIKVSGFYMLADPEAALRALVEPFGGRVIRVSPWNLVVL